MNGEHNQLDVMTGQPDQTTSGEPGFPPEGSLPPGDQHHEDAPRRGLEPALAGALRDREPYGPAGAGSDQLWSLLAYLGMAVFAFIPPLVVYLAKWRESPFVRYHAAQALNLWITAFGYTVSCFIVGVLLALDTAGTALAVTLPLACVIWVSAVGYAIAGGLAAKRGRQRELPRWICSQAVR